MQLENGLKATDSRLLVNMILHDLEKPMAVNTRILGRILDGTLDPHNETHCRLIRSAFHAGARLKRMLADLNEVLDGRMMTAQRSPQRVTDLVEAAAQEFLPLAQSEAVRFVWNSTTQAVINTDPDLISRILLNYLYNALAHTGPDGDIRLAANAVMANKVVIRVENKGPVIPETMMESIFQPGVQLDLRSQRRWRGHGLGLAFCRLAAEALNGRAGGGNLPEGAGMVFYLELRADSPHHKPGEKGV